MKGMKRETSVCKKVCGMARGKLLNLKALRFLANVLFKIWSSILNYLGPESF
jgi:hypothetical protein